MMQKRPIKNPFPGLRPFETDEYRLFFEWANDESKGRLQLIHHAMFNTLEENIEAVQIAEKEGCELVLLVRPAGLFGRTDDACADIDREEHARIEQRRGDLHQRRLARAVRPEQPEDARGRPQRDASERADAARVGLLQVSYLKHGFPKGLRQIPRARTSSILMNGVSREAPRLDTGGGAGFRP